MQEVLLKSSFFGIVLTLFAYLIGLKLSSKYKLTILNPILIASIIIIILLLSLNISYTTYNESAKYLSYLLTPSTICLAVPMYKEIEVLKKNSVAILLSILVGSIFAVLSVVFMTLILNFDLSMTKSLMPKSITTAIALSVSEEIGGIPTITVMSVVLTGIFGAIVAEKICEIFHIKNPISIGLAHGCASHAIGTSKALQIGEVEGAMSSLAIIIAGVMTVFIIPVITKILL